MALYSPELETNRDITFLIRQFNAFEWIPNISETNLSICTCVCIRYFVYDCVVVYVCSSVRVYVY